jgi:hypothetical protein
MTRFGILFVSLLVVLVAFILLEGRRQKKKYSRQDSGSRLIRTGMLKLQAFLEPEKKIELLMHKEDGTVIENPSDDLRNRDKAPSEDP